MQVSQNLKTLQHGDLVRHCNGDCYVVISNDGHNVVAIRSIHVDNNNEWTVVKRHDWRS